MSTGRRIILTEEADWWVAKDVHTGVASQGETREAALEMLDEAVALHESEGDSIDTWEDEAELLEELGIDPEEVKQAREERDSLPEFMQ